MLEQFLMMIGMSEIQSQIYCAVIRHGSSPASTIADQLWRERTSTYKLMKQMVELWYLTQSMRHGSAVFTHMSLDTLKRIRDAKLSQTMHLSEHYDVIVREYEQLDQSVGNSPRISISQWVTGLSNTLDQMLQLITSKSLIRITCIASMTFDSLWTADDDVARMMASFRTQLNVHRVSVDGYYATGMLLMEQLRTHLWSLESLPTSHDAVSLRVVSDCVFLIIMQSQPQIITIQSRIYADLLLFVASQLESK